MSKFDDGGNAFPFTQKINQGLACDDNEITYEGMSIWDYFAAHAPNPPDGVELPNLELPATEEYKGSWQQYETEIELIIQVEWRARYADAMLKERTKRQSK